MGANVLNCKSKNLIYLIECKKCTKQYIGETKRQLHERFGEHRRSIQNHHQLAKPTPVCAHFNQPGHSIDHLLLTPLELIHSKRDSVRKAREAHLINKAMTLEPLGINRRDEQNLLLFINLSELLILYFKALICNGHFVFLYSFSFSSRRRFVFQTEISGKYIMYLF